MNKTNLISSLHSYFQVFQKTKKSNPPLLPLSDHEIKKIAGTVSSLSKKFNDRMGFSPDKYLNQPDLLSAYLYYFWPVTYAQARYILDFLPFVPQKALDLGCGPGPFSFALCDSGAKSVLAADYSPLALDWIRKIAEETRSPISTFKWDATKNISFPNPPYDCIVLSHLLNELWGKNSDRIQKRIALLSSLQPFLSDTGCFILVEPALHETSHDLLLLRDSLLTRGWEILSPCLHQGTCPALGMSEGVCYSYFSWDPPPLLKKIALQSGVTKQTVKMTYFILRKKLEKSSTPVKPLYRVISYPMHNKAGRTRLLLCGPEGKITLSAKKGEPFPAVKTFFSLERGDRIEIFNPEKRENGLGVGPQTKITQFA